jgi:hypothetical protein
MLALLHGTWVYSDLPVSGRRYGGTSRTGDGGIIEFRSVVDAVQSPVKNISLSSGQSLRIRIGDTHHRVKAGILLVQGHLDEAIAQSERALALDRTIADAYSTMADLTGFRANSKRASSSSIRQF